MLDWSSSLKLTNARLNPFLYNVGNLLPTGSVLSQRHVRALFSNGYSPAPCTYEATPSRIPFPILPFQVFGVAYDLDLVVVADHPKWTMHEFARIPTSRGPVWMAKESDPNGIQTVLADETAIRELAPEVDVPRKVSPVRVTDRSKPGWIDITIAYLNSDDEEVVVSYAGKSPQPMPLPFLRNGNTMGHSRKTILAIIDIARQSVGRTPTITIGGKSVKCVRLFFGAQPFAYALEQVQGGLSAASFTQHFPTDGAKNGFALGRGETQATPSETWLEKSWKPAKGPGEGVEVYRQDRMTRIAYRYLRRGDALEFCEAEVTQAGRSESCFLMRVQPSLPDPRLGFAGQTTSRFTIDVNGRIAHGTGLIRASAAQFEILPDAPRWAATRPLRSKFSLAPVRVESIRV